MELEIEKFKELKNQGLTNQQIANYFKISLSTLKRFISKNNLSVRKKDINLEDFLRLYEEGKQDDEIASILGITKFKTSNYRKSLNLKSQTDRKREINQQKFLNLFREGKSDSEIARILNVNHVTVHNWRKTITGEESNFVYSRQFNTDKFMDLYNQGLNYAEIANVLQVSSSSIQNYASSLNLTPNTYNKDVPTYEQQQIIIGSLLGDMSLKMPSGAVHASGDFAHSLKQENYCKFLESKLHNFCTKGFYRSYIDSRTKKQYNQYYVYMKASEYLTILYNKFYQNGIKKVPKDLLYLLDGLGIAIWFMDDGYKDGKSYRLATNCFSIEDLKVIVEFFKIKFGIVVTIHSSHVIRIATKSAEDFKNLIKDFIHEDCLYKL
jgi:DNA-binding CsgD family transcriptional regulator